MTWQGRSTLCCHDAVCRARGDRKRAPLLLTTEVSVICLAIKTARDGTRHRSKESQRNLCSFGLNTFYKLNKLRTEQPDCGYCVLTIVRWPGPGRWQHFLQLCRFICSGLLAAGCWRLARLAECPIIQILRASVSSLILFSFPPFGQSGAEKININEAGSLLFSDCI